jgi:serine O-acetyltransferase
MADSERTQEEAAMSRVVLAIHRAVFTLRRWGVPVLPALINKVFIRLLFACQLGEETVIGKNVDLGYGGLGVVIHRRAVIGDNVSIGSGVTIGGTSGKYEVPVIGDNTIISSGAKILGPITVGENCVIGANAVVLSSVPDNCVAVGVPARIVKTDIDISDYLD